MEVVNRSVQIIGMTLQTDDLLEATVAQVVETIKCTNCTIFFPVLEGNKTLLVPRKSYGRHAEQIKQRRFQADEGVVGQVFQTGKSIRSEDIRSHPAFAKATRDLGIPRSMLAVPITVGDQTIGVISADQDIYGWFTENDQQLIEALARHVGIATERATAFEQLQQISLQITSASDIRTILARIAEGAIKITNSSSCGIYLLSDDQQSITDSFQFPADIGLPMPRIYKKKGLIYTVANSGIEIVIRDVVQDSRVNPTLVGKMKSTITLPLKLNEKVIGVMHLNDENEREFRETERSLLRTLASQAVLFIEKARLMKQERQAKAHAETLREISIATSQDLNIETTLRLIVENAKNLTDADVGIIHLIDPVTHRLVQNIAEPPIFDNFFTRFEYKRGFIWDVYQHGDIKVIEDLKTSQYATKTLLQGGVRSMIGLPLTQSIEVIGVLCLKSYHEYHFKQDEMRLLQVLVEQASLAIERSQHYKQRVKDISVLEAINEAILQKDFAEVIDLIVREAKKLTKATICRLSLLDSSKQILREVASVGTPSRYPQLPKDSKSITGNVALTGKAEIYPDMRQYPYPTFAEGAESCMCVPLRYNHEVIGTLFAEGTQVGIFLSEKAQIDLFQTLANQAAIAIETAQLYEEMEKRVEERTKAWQAEQKRVMQAEAEKLALLLGDTAAQFAHRLNNSAGFISLRIDLAKEKLNAQNEREAQAIILLDAISNETQQLLQAPKRILVTSRSLSPNSIEPVDVNRQLENVICDFQASNPELGRSIQLVTNFANTLPPIYINKDGLIETLRNMLQNGLDAMSGKGCLTITSRQTTSYGSAQIEILISDTGVGIDEEYHNKIFDLFFSTKRDGYGLGLWRDRTYMRAFGGDVELIHSEVGKGTTFKVKIPITDK